MAFDTIYSFTVKVTNSKNTSRTVTDTPSFYVNAPETTSPVNSCIDYSMNITNSASLPGVTALSTNNLQLIVNSLSYIDVKIGKPYSNVASSCTNLQSYITLVFISFSNTNLFSDIKSYPYNSSLVTITAAQQQKAFSSSVKQQSFTSYIYILNSVTNQILGYNYVMVTLSLKDSSLWA